MAGDMAAPSLVAHIVSAAVRKGRLQKLADRLKLLLDGDSYTLVLSLGRVWDAASARELRTLVHRWSLAVVTGPGPEAVWRHHRVSSVARGVPVAWSRSRCCSRRRRSGMPPAWTWAVPPCSQHHLLQTPLWRPLTRPGQQCSRPRRRAVYGFTSSLCWAALRANRALSER